MLRVLLLLGSAGISFGVSEWIWRRVAEFEYRGRLKEFQNGQNGMVESTPDQPWLYGLLPNLDFVENITQPDGRPPVQVRYRTNADGFRHHEAWPPRMDDQAVRILCVSDSYGFGLGVQDGESFPYVVESELRAQGIDAVAINTGVPGYNSEQQYARLPSLLERYRPRVCVIGYVMNDAEPISIVPMPPREAYRHCWFWLFEDAKPLLNRVAALIVDDRPLFASSKPSESKDYPEGFLPGSPKWPASRAALVGMYRLCRERGVRMLVAVMPDFTRSFDDTYPLVVIHESVVNLGAAEGFPVLDLFPAVRGLDASKLFVPGDGHPNAQGQRLLGEGIARRVLELLRG